MHHQSRISPQSLRRIRVPATPTAFPKHLAGAHRRIFNVSYTQQVLNEPLRGQAKELQEQARSQRIVLEDVRNSVIVRTAMAYLELGKVRHSLELLRAEQDSADKILEVTQRPRRAKASSCPWKSPRPNSLKLRLRNAFCSSKAARMSWKFFCARKWDMRQINPWKSLPEDLPGEAEQEGANLIAMAMQNNTSLQLAESDVRAKEFRLKGEKRGYFPTLELVSVYSVLGKFNNYDKFFRTFERNNFNAGIQVQVPIFSARTKANIALAEVNLAAAQANLNNKKTEFSAEVRQKTRSVREKDAAKEVARLELQLAQQDVAVLQSQFAEGKLNLREVERARLSENEKWMAYLDANFARQQAQLELLRAAGQLDKVWQ